MASAAVASDCGNIQSWNIEPHLRTFGSLEARDREVERIALQVVDEADYIAAADPVSVERTGQGLSQEFTFIVTYSVRRAYKGGNAQTVRVGYLYWCEECANQSDQELLAPLRDRPGYVLAAQRLDRRPVNVNEPPYVRAWRARGVTLASGSCQQPLFIGHPEVDRWVHRRLLWLSGRTDPQWAHWGPPPAR